MKSDNTRFKISLIVGGVFIIGFLSGIGTVATFLFVKGPPVPFFDVDDPQPPLPIVLMKKRMFERLDLTQQQRIKIEHILEQSRNKLRKFRRAARPGIRQILDDSANKIRAVLNPDQQKKFNRHVKKMRRRFKKGMGRGWQKPD
jgi:hypothetical protein